MIHLHHFGATLSVSDHKRWMLKPCRWLAVDVVDESLRNMPAACTRGQGHSRCTVHSRSDMHSVASVTALLLHFAWFKFSVALRPQRPQGLLETGSPGRRRPLSHSSVLLYVHRDRRRRGAQDGHLQFYTVHDVALRPQRPQGLLETGSPGRPPPISHNSVLLYVQRP